MPNKKNDKSEEKQKGELSEEAQRRIRLLLKVREKFGSGAVALAQVMLRPIQSIPADFDHEKFMIQLENELFKDHNI